MPSTLLRRLTITLAIVFTGAAAPAHAANTYVVNSTANTPDATVADASCRTADNVCTLRAAIQQANATGNDPGAPDQIMVGVGRITLDTQLPRSPATSTFGEATPGRWCGGTRRPSNGCSRSRKARTPASSASRSP